MNFGVKTSLTRRFPSDWYMYPVDVCRRAMLYQRQALYFLAERQENKGRQSSLVVFSSGASGNLGQAIQSAAALLFSLVLCSSHNATLRLRSIMGRTGYYCTIHYMNQTI